MTLAAFALFSSPAFAAKARFTIRGAGFGHGVGMSQYGALGFAQQGRTYDQILRHYYTGTGLGTTDPAATVRVLLQSTGTASFSGASQAGSRRVNPGRTYQVRRRGSTQVDLLSASGRRIASFTAPLQVSGPEGVVQLGGSGAYRGLLEFRPDPFGGVNAINAVSLEDYVAGVVSRESPSSWPAEALKAQAVAARTYAITTSKAGNGWDQYADTRSQVYGGVAAETATTNAAVAATRAQVVTYDGAPVVTFFFSTSGGRTENVENTNVGAGPQPHLKSVVDPYDSVSPKHRWTPIKLTLAQAGAKLVRAREGPLQGHPGPRARALAADRGRRHRRLGRPHAGRRRDAARPPRPARHLGLLHDDRDPQGAAAGLSGNGRRRPTATRRRGGLGGPGARRRRGPGPGPRRRALGDRRVHRRAARRALPRGGRPRWHLPRRLLGRRGAVDPRAVGTA